MIVKKRKIIITGIIVITQRKKHFHTEKRINFNLISIKIIRNNKCMRKITLPPKLEEKKKHLL